jgi:hypothetical protein
VLLEVDEAALGVRPLRDPFERKHGDVELLRVVDDDDRAQRVALPRGGEDLVLGVARVVDVGRIDHDGLRSKLAAESATAVGWRDVVRGGPVDDRQSDVHVLGEDDVRKLGGIAMDVRVAGVPAPARHVDPALERQAHLDRLAPHFDALRQRAVLFSPFHRERVAPGASST